MQKVITSELKQHEGEILARDVFYNGQLLYQRNSVIDTSMINRLTELRDYIFYIFSYKSEVNESISAMSEIMNDEIIGIIKNEIDLIFHRYSYKEEDDTQLIRTITEYFLENILNQNYFRNYLENLFIINNRLFNHSIRVTVISLILAIKANLNQEFIYGIAIGSVLHEIGRNKLYIEFPVLAKNNHIFNQEEYHLAEMIPVLGFNEVRNNKLVPLCSKKIILYHNVWEDFESSYDEERKVYMSHPLYYENYKLTAEQKDIGVNIVQAANCFDMFMIRFKEEFKGLSDYRNLNEAFTRNSKNIFSKEAYDLLTKHISCFSINEEIELSNGQHGFIYKHTDDPWRPIIKLNDSTIINLKDYNEEVYIKKHKH